MQQVLDKTGNAITNTLARLPHLYHGSLKDAEHKLLNPYEYKRQSDFDKENHEMLRGMEMSRGALQEFGEAIAGITHFLAHPLVPVYSNIHKVKHPKEAILAAIFSLGQMSKEVQDIIIHPENHSVEELGEAYEEVLNSILAPESKLNKLAQATTVKSIGKKLANTSKHTEGVKMEGTGNTPNHEESSHHLKKPHQEENKGTPSKNPNNSKKEKHKGNNEPPAKIPVKHEKLTQEKINALPPALKEAYDKSNVIDGTGEKLKTKEVKATVFVNGHKFTDYNQNLRKKLMTEGKYPEYNHKKPMLIKQLVDKAMKRKKKDLPNGEMGTAHAETGALQQAHEAGVAKGQHVDMIIDGESICTHCKGDIPKMLHEMGVESATIYDKSLGIIYKWKQNVNSLHVKD